MSEKVSNSLRSATVRAARGGIAVKERLRSGLNAPGKKLKGIMEEAREAYEKEETEKIAARIKKTQEEVEKLDIYIETLEKKLEEKKIPVVLKKPAEKPDKNKAPVEEEVQGVQPKDELAWIYSSVEGKSTEGPA